MPLRVTVVPGTPRPESPSLFGQSSSCISLCGGQQCLVRGCHRHGSSEALCPCETRAKHSAASTAQHRTSCHITAQRKMHVARLCLFPITTHCTFFGILISNRCSVLLPLCCVVTDASRQSIPDLHHMMRRSSSSSSCCDHNHDHQHQHDHQSRSHGSGRSDSSSSSSSHSSATSIADSSSHTHSHDSSNSSKPEKLTEDQAALLVKFNAFGDDYEDLAAAAVRGAAVPHSHMGLWPQFAMFNHACLPNAVHYNVGHALVVRAMEDVPAGRQPDFYVLFG